MTKTDRYGLLGMNVFDATIDSLAECFGDLWGLVRSVRPLHALGAVALAYAVMFAIGLLCAL